MKEEQIHNNNFDLLDMSNYRIERLPKRKKSRFEGFLAIIGGPLAIISFVLIYFIFNPAFLVKIDPGSLSDYSSNVFQYIGAAEFSRINIAMLAIFLAGVILWLTGAIPNYLTSLIIIISLALPVAFLIEHVYMLPFNSKPAALLYETDQYSLTNTFKFGFTMLVIGWLINILMGETWYRYLGITPDGVFGIF